jgi:hypothetical protein
MSSFACGEEGLEKALPAMFLIWSLTRVKNHDITKEEQRTLAKGRLRFIADLVGLKYAHVVNDVGLSYLGFDRPRKLTNGSSTRDSLPCLCDRTGLWLLQTRYEVRLEEGKG